MRAILVGANSAESEQRAKRSWAEELAGRSRCRVCGVGHRVSRYGVIGVDDRGATHREVVRLPVIPETLDRRSR
jgi:hypothetical protein